MTTADYALIAICCLLFAVFVLVPWIEILIELHEKRRGWVYVGQSGGPKFENGWLNADEPRAIPPMHQTIWVLPDDYRFKEHEDD